MLPVNTQTFCSKDSGHTSWLDHFIISNNLEPSVTLVSIPFDISPSDHIPISLEMNIKISNYDQDNLKEKISYHNWKSLSSQLLLNYSELTKEFLHKLTTWKLCENSLCTNKSHCNEIADVCSLLISCLQRCETQVFKQRSMQKEVNASRQIIGWNKHLKSYYANYRSSFSEWIQSNRSSERAFLNMKQQCKLFKRELKRVRRNEVSVKCDNLATQLYEKNFYKFWRQIKSSEKSKSILPSTINGTSGESNICEMWKEHFEKSFATSATSEMLHNCPSRKCKKQEVYRVKGLDVADCILSLKSGKTKGSDGLTAESLKFASPIIVDIIANIVNSCLAHSFLPDVVMKVILVPILKKSTLDPSIVKNYRPIALASILSKVFEDLIYKKYQMQLVTHPGQFGYKKKVGCETTIFTLRQISHHYLRKGSNVYLCYLDATRAFDTVDHGLLLEKLCNRGLNEETIKLLEFWFINQQFQCRWGSCLSKLFHVRSGVRQGGKNSAYYFAVYMDDMCHSLEESGVGCRVGTQMTNFLAYADDYVIMANSISAMKTLLAICDKYAKEHSIMFNASKTFLQAFINRDMDYCRPILKLSGKIIQWTDTVKYLGYAVNCWDRDHTELLHRRHEIYAQANMIKAKFVNCSVAVKKYLFDTYFSSLYCMSLWCPVKQKDLDAVRVAYNNAFRCIFGYAYDCSASSMFLENGVNDFSAIRRRAVFSLLRRISSSDNLILKIIFNSRVLIDSTLFQAWHNLLLKPYTNEQTLYQILTR